LAWQLAESAEPRPLRLGRDERTDLCPIGNM